MRQFLADVSLKGEQDQAGAPSGRATGSTFDIVQETDRLLAVRRRDRVLGEEMLTLYEQASWRQRSAIVRSAMKWVTVMALCAFFFNLAYMPQLLLENFLVCCIGLPIINALVYWTWRKPRSHRVEGGAIVAWCSLTMIQMSLLGLLAGGYNQERYATAALFVATIAVMVFGIRLSWAKILAASSLVIFLAASLLDPLLTLMQTVVLFCFYGLGLVSTVVGRRTSSLLSHEAFLMSLRDRYRQKSLDETNRKLEKLASTDPLTGLFNRRSAKSEIDVAWSDPLRRGRGLAILMCDIDHFKMLNDNYGHAVGDDCLRRIADAISLAVDPEGDIVARFGGEEFLVCLCDVDQGMGIETADRIRRNVEDLAIPNPKAPAGIVTLSLGLAQGLHGSTSERVTVWADEALYQAKQQGRNRVCAFAGNVSVLAAQRPAGEAPGDQSPQRPIGLSAVT